MGNLHRSFIQQNTIFSVSIWMGAVAVPIIQSIDAWNNRNPGGHTEGQNTLMITQSIITVFFETAPAR